MHVAAEEGHADSSRASDGDASRASTYYNITFIHSFMALTSVQDRSEDGNESVLLERSETYPSNKLVLMLVNRLYDMILLYAML